MKVETNTPRLDRAIGDNKIIDNSDYNINCIDVQPYLLDEQFFREEEASITDVVQDIVNNSMSKTLKSNILEWDSIVPLEDKMMLPSIDKGILPPILQDFCTACSESLEVSLESVLCTSLACISIAIQKKFYVEIKEGYREPTNTYWLIALPPSERKSSIVSLCRSPIEEWEREKQRNEIVENKQRESEKKTLQKAIEYKRNQASKADRETFQKFTQEIAELELHLPEPYVYTRLLADDITPEALGCLLANQNGKIGILEAEGGLFHTIAGRYSQGVPNLDVLLKGYSSEHIRIDRKNSAPIFVEHAHITLFLFVQPCILQNRGAGEVFRGRGLDARFIYFFPKSKVGNRKLDTESIPIIIKQRYAQHIRMLLDIQCNEEPYTLKLDQEAYEEWLSFSQKIERKLLLHSELGSLSDWGGKLPGLVARLAGILYCATHTVPQKYIIDKETMQKACYLGDIFIKHAQYAYGFMAGCEDKNNAIKILKWIQSTGIEQFSARDCFSKHRDMGKQEVVNKALKILVEHGYIREFDRGRKREVGRKPSPQYEVNPTIR